jgi:hypothetical protein
MTGTTTKPKEEHSTSGEDDTQYPSSKIVLPAIAAIWLAFFVVALVRSSQRPIRINWKPRGLTAQAGPNYYRNSCTHHLQGF